MSTVEKVVILDFGSQYTQLIARRIREQQVYSEIVPATTSAEAIKKMNPQGVVLSGGPASPTDGTITFDPEILGGSVPILGICYGMQTMNLIGKGTVKSAGAGEYGKQSISLEGCSALFQGLKQEQRVWMSHGVSVEALSEEYKAIATSSDGVVAAVAHKEKPLFGVQFHPEVTHTEQGAKMLSNFLDLCRCQRNWTVGSMVEEGIEEIRQKVGAGRVVSLVSGGVDSTAATILCLKALGPDRVFPLHIDNGLMREGESKQVIKLLQEQGITNLRFVDAQQQFLDALKGVTEPEKKRTIIGDLFIKILEEEMESLEAHDGTTFFCQGTLYTDLVESGKGCGKHAAVIKSHHNVNPPIVAEKRRQGLIIEPNAHIFKDEVRKVSEALGVPHHLSWRHPFPGPGLGIRIIGEVTHERLRVLRHSDKLFLEEISKAGLYDEIWQAFAVMVPATTVGVMGDGRTEGEVIALRAVTSSDGMTADVYPMPIEVLTAASTRIVNEVEGINRVVYDVTSKPPATIEWE